MRIGIFGGTFDPPHFGHLIPVESAREMLRLDQVRIVPAALSPHKVSKEGTDPVRRLAMVRMAFGGNPAFVIDDRELRREPPSYMVDTLAEMRRDFRADTLYLLLGSDNLSDFNSWKDPERILSLATVVAMARPFTSPEDTAASCVSRITRLNTPLVEISSSLIRDQVRNGRSIRYLVPDGVRQYIEQERLYRE